ncbi:MAG: hypothetical protein OEQ39_20270 [Gammaproteobacteria bacterium]|nr:hypothetical protein [Gammaproteobacteria bacterium]MDH3464710.1 hypothetical protein [Gammaproteobacteria bacterium]
MCKSSSNRHTLRSGQEMMIVLLDAERWEEHASAIMAIEAESYEPGRRDSFTFLDRVVQMPRNASLLAIVDRSIAGFCFGGPLEEFAETGGVRSDPHWGRNDALYAADLTVAAPYRGQGVAQALKRAQIERTVALGFRVYAGRNRVGLADAMWHINRAAGAREVQRITDAYSDDLGPRSAIYYHIDLADRQLPSPQ